MKLLNCTSCHDFVGLLGTWRACACGLSAARGLAGGRSAEVWGHGRILEMDGSEYGRSLDDRRVSMSCRPMAEDGLRVRRVRRRPRPE